MFHNWKERKLIKSRITLMLGGEGFDEYRRQPFSPQVNPVRNSSHSTQSLSTGRVLDPAGFIVKSNLAAEQRGIISNGVNEKDLRIGGVKIIVHEVTGRLTPDQNKLNEMVLHIHRLGFQAILHAIEEPAIEAACSAIKYALKAFHRSDHRHRIEHCSVCSQSLAKRLASLGIMVVTQPPFIYYNGERYLRTVPASNLKHLYPIATLMKNGVKVVGSSDCPVVRANPLIGIYSSVSRRAENGESVLPEEKISPQEALKMYTKEAAKTTFEETIKGSITPGKLADLVVLNGDPAELPVEAIKDIQVELTILNGEVVWNRMS